MSELHVANAYLLTEASGTPMALPQISLDFAQSGVMVSAQISGETKLLPWSSLVDITASPQAEMPDGETGILVEITSVDRVHRFVIPASSGEGSYLTKAIVAMKAYCAAPSASSSPEIKRATPVWQVVILGILLILLAVVLGLIVAKAKGAF